MTRTAEAKKEPAVKSDADTSASPGDARPEGSQLSDKLAALIAPDVSLVAPATSGSRFFVTALALSVILHLGVVVYLQWDNTDEVGPGGIQLEAVNVDLIPLSDLRSGAPSVAPDAGRDAIDQDKKDPMEAARRDVTETPPPEGFLKPSEGTSDLAAAEIIKPDPVLDGKEQLDKEKLDKPEEPDTASDVRGRTKQSFGQRRRIGRGNARPDLAIRTLNPTDFERKPPAPRWHPWARRREVRIVGHRHRAICRDTEFEWIEGHR
jgi:hypothetical protein